VGVGVGPVRVGDIGVGVEDGIVSLESNNDFAMGAPPGTPGTIREGVTPRGLNLEGIGRRRNITLYTYMIKCDSRIDTACICFVTQ
jgi:hypothetical protein